MAKQVFKLDIECREDGRSNRIRVPIGGDQPVRRLLEIVRERSNMSLTTLYTLRDGHKALLDPDDTLYLVLDAGENRLRAEATPAKASAPPPLRSRSRSPARRKRSEKARLHEQRGPRRSANSQRDKVLVVKQAFDSRRRSALLSVRPGDVLELGMLRDRGWLACRQLRGQRDVGWVPEWVFCAPREVCNQEEDLSDEREEPPADPGAKGCIKRIKAITGQYVDRVEFQLRSGIHQVYGESTGGCSSECFAVEKDEAVVEVTQIPTRKYLAQMLEFKTSKGRIFSTKGYGGPGKEPQRIVFAAPEGRQICGLVFEGVKLSAVCHQKCSKTGSRKHPQKLVENFMAGFNAYQ
ncbi:unnamed protein product [Symbiodinium necroappetens]|uniref:Jacalin-type lectin domain-containing protein n=1 Tax=Symbiodinium necroappetens TaxID=1628268 RepID=A0A812W2Q9_9DINO|nr:unnamed protein product [Symbiodinium necroappetens]